MAVRKWNPNTASGLRICLENADSLTADAELLLASGRPYRAVSLAVLALEELGKSILLNSDRLDGQPRLRDRLFKTHSFKSGLFAHVASRIHSHYFRDELPAADWQKWGQELDALKMKFFYTDHVQGKYVSPLLIEDAEAIARKYVGIARKGVNSFRVYVDTFATPPDEFPETFRRHYGLLYGIEIPKKRPRTRSGTPNTEGRELTEPPGEEMQRS